MPTVLHDPRLASLPVASVAFALGMSVALPQTPETAGRISLLVSDLKRRGAWEMMTSVMDPELVRSIELLATTDRSRWKAQRRTPR